MRGDVIDFAVLLFEELSFNRSTICFVYFHPAPRGRRKTLVPDVTYSVLLCSEDLIGFMKAFSFLSAIGRRHGVQSKACFGHLIDPDCFCV